MALEGAALLHFGAVTGAKSLDRLGPRSICSRVLWGCRERFALVAKARGDVRDGSDGGVLEMALAGQILISPRVLSNSSAAHLIEPRFSR
jgi:hypothetical protein